MPRYVIDIPETEHEFLITVARDENVPPRVLLIWMLKREFAERLKQYRRKRAPTARVA